MNMSGIYGKLCSLLLEEHFGSIVQLIGTDLISNSKRSLHSILFAVDLPPKKVNNKCCNELDTTNC